MDTTSEREPIGDRGAFDDSPIPLNAKDDGELGERKQPYQRAIDERKGYREALAQARLGKKKQRPPLTPTLDMYRQDREMYHRVQSSFRGLQYDAAYNSTRPKDVTLHLEFDIVSDLDDQLEELNCLMRRGDFANADNFFSQHLAAHDSHPWVFVQHAEMLLEMGDFKSFHELDPGRAFLSLESTLVGRQNVGSWFPYNLAVWGNWKAIYRQLLKQGRIWDFRDVFTLSWVLFGAESAQEEFFGPRDMLDALVTDWLTTESDESTLLALLDILVFMLRFDDDSVEITPFTERCLSSAGAIGKSLMEKFPHSFTTRTFLQWILVQSLVSSRRENKGLMSFSHLLNYAGIANLPSRFGLPYYLPILQENPGWAKSAMTPESFRPLEMVLRASRDNKDYVTERMCLIELATRQSDPTSTLSQLCYLQKEMQQNMRGYLSTCLSRYLIANDDESREQLFKDLNDLGPWKDLLDCIDPDRACARDIIQQGLSAREKDDEKNNLEVAIRYYPRLSTLFQNAIDRRVDFSSYRRPTASKQGKQPDTTRKRLTLRRPSYRDSGNTQGSSCQRGSTREFDINENLPYQTGVPKPDKKTSQLINIRPEARPSRSVTAMPTIDDVTDSGEA
ncbi:hypothetical protein F66182_3091 [Fusarium sp. NRRL 66182]|nr:hypothetical protein F66182_3091 [Fusarium sp. NRRL 66182]